MLQIITGKFFTPGASVHTTRHRAVLYTNYQLLQPIETPVGVLLPAHDAGGLATVTVRVRAGQSRLET